VIFGHGGRGLERLAGGSQPRGTRTRTATPTHWPTQRAGQETWRAPGPAAAAQWTRGPSAGLAREALQQSLLFPVTRLVAHPQVHGAQDLHHAPQPALLTANHASDLDTPLILAALPYSWRSRTLVGAAADRFYRRRRYALASTLWIGTFPFDREGDGRGLAQASALLREGWNLLLYPQGTRSHGVGGFRTGVARLALATDAPIVPVHVGGTALLMPKGRGLTQRGTATVRFGRPLLPAGTEEPHELSQRIADAVGDLADARPGSPLRPA